MKIRKSIAYAYPTSTRADQLGVYEIGGYYVAQSILREDFTWSPPYIAIGGGNEAFTKPDDPDLIALFFEVDGEPCPMLLRNGNSRALAAIATNPKGIQS